MEQQEQPQPVIQIPVWFDGGLQALCAALIAELDNGGAVLIRCEYCGNCDGPFQYIGTAGHIVETPFVNEWRDLLVSHCRDCMR